MYGSWWENLAVSVACPDLHVWPLERHSSKLIFRLFNFNHNEQYDLWDLIDNNWSDLPR